MFTFVFPCVFCNFPIQKDIACFTISRCLHFEKLIMFLLALHCYPPFQLFAMRTFFHRSEEHTSELQSRFDLVCRLLLEKKRSEYARRSRSTKRRVAAQ